MGRSVSYANNSVYVEYSHIEQDDEYDCSDDFDWYIQDFQSQLKAAFKSVDVCDNWVGREDHCVASNQFANFGISEYCNLVSIWCAPVEADYDQSAGWEALRDNWISQIEKTFKKIARNSFGQAIVKVGTFSNGESFFRAAA